MEGENKVSEQPSSSSRYNKTNPAIGNKSSKANRSKSSIVQQELRKKNLMMLKRGIKTEPTGEPNQSGDQNIQVKDERRDSSPDLEEILASKEVVTPEDVMKLQRCCRG